MRSALAFSTLCMAASVLWPAAASAETTLSAVNLGEHWYGPEYSTSDLKGRVVLIEKWGYN